MAYRTPRALEMALKSAAKASPMDTGRAVAGFYRHRLLCRVFSDPESSFLLKGGQSMLSRTIDARATRDIDLLNEGGDLDAALVELRRLAEVDLDDFVTFEFMSAEPIKVEDEYRSGFNVRFSVYLGAKRMQEVSIDLVVDEVPQDGYDVVTPADRVELPDVPVYDYRVYKVASALADKFCGILEEHGGTASSRVKDLVDVVVYALTEPVVGDELIVRLRAEAGARGIVLPPKFTVPAAWHGLYGSSFVKVSRQAGILGEGMGMDEAELIAARLFDSALDDSAMGKTWDPVIGRWQDSAAC